MGKIVRNGVNYSYAENSFLVASVYSESQSYSIGDYVVYNEHLYKCISNTSAGNFNPSKWIETNTSNEIKTINKSIENRQTSGTGWMLDKTEVINVLSFDSFDITTEITIATTPKKTMKAAGILLYNNLNYYSEVDLDTSKTLKFYYYENGVKKLATIGKFTGQLLWTGEV